MDLGTMTDAEVAAILPQLTQAETWRLFMSAGAVVVHPNSNPTGNPALVIRDRDAWARLVSAVGQRKAEAMAVRQLRT